MTIQNYDLSRNYHILSSNWQKVWIDKMSKSLNYDLKSWNYHVLNQNLQKLCQNWQKV